MTRPEIEDAETVTITGEVLGPPVDPPDEPRTLYATITNTLDSDMVPIIPAWMRNAGQRRETIKHGTKIAAHKAGRHLWLSPRYAGKVLAYSPLGILRGLWIICTWTFDLQAWKLQQHASTNNDHDNYVKAQRPRDRHVRVRSSIVFPLAFLLLIACILFAALAPWWQHVIACVAAAFVFAVVGRPQGKTITERTTVGATFTKLTAEQVRAALVAMRINGIKDPGDVSFPPPGIHRDGAGYLAKVHLPIGVEAVTVVKERGRLSSALRLPLDQVWPSVGSGHEGELDLYVPLVPVSKMTPPRWSLASSSARTSAFDGFPIGFDERQRSIKFTPFERNLLIGGQPGSGKTFAARAVTIGGLLDPTSEVWLAAFKPSEDFYDLSPYCSRYVCGVDETALDQGAQMVSAGLAEVHRRQELLGKLKRAGKIIDGRTTPELAAAGMGLHPLFLVFDEVHELLANKDAAAGMARLLKQGRSAGVMCILATQVASAASVPTEITKVVSSRWCLSVLDQVANDQIMGTGAYKRGRTGTVYRPGVDQGWGVTSGIQDNYEGAARCAYPAPRELTTILRRIEQVRRGSINADSYDQTFTPTRAFIDDLRISFNDGETFMSWQTAAARLVERWPDAYAGLTSEAASQLGRDRGLRSIDGKENGRTLKGLRLDGVLEVLQAAQIGAS